mmetsp:Transcript_19046/g.33545  ORF Transcript_19046/g.33545 Transcript_19046/m.33545 type:complete len:88 (+) Transcript_19046:162-425(+)
MLTKKTFENEDLQSRISCVIVGRVLVQDYFACTMGMEIRVHVVALFLHHLAHVVKGGGRDQMARAVDLPSDGGVLGADCVVTGGSSG